LKKNIQLPLIADLIKPFLVFFNICNDKRGEAGAYPSGASVSPANIRHGLKWLPVANTLAYFVAAAITIKMGFIRLAQSSLLLGVGPLNIFFTRDLSNPGRGSSITSSKLYKPF